MYIRRYNRFVDLSISSTLPPPTGRNVKLYVAKSLQIQPVVCTYTHTKYASASTEPYSCNKVKANR